VEAGITSHKALDLIIEEYLQEFREEDTLILGCTHYPFLKKAIKKFFVETHIIDTGEAASKIVSKELIEENSKIGKIEYYLSDKPNNFINIAEKNLGMDLLFEALKKIADKENFQIAVVGRGNVEIPDLGFETKRLNFIKDENKLAELYSSFDLTLVPSRYETFHQTTLESIACGTPVVAFDNSGPADILIHKKTGYLAKAHLTEDFRRGIEWIFSGELSYSDLVNNSIERSSEFKDIDKAKEYKALYESILK
jgi:glycosyltransferase involved in cell wall biosynthesis